MHAHVNLEPPFPSVTAPTILALPGAGCSPAIYDALDVPGWTLLGVDWYRTEGPVDPVSVAGRVLAALRHCKGPVALVGHSAGAAIAALVAAMAGTDTSLAALVLSNTGVHSRHHGDPTLTERIANRWTADEQQAFLRACFKVAPPEPLWEAMRGYLASIAPATLLQSVQGLRALDLTANLGRISVPTLVAHGRDDTRRRVADAQALAAGIPGARLTLLPGGHTPMVDCTAEYEAALTEFFDARGGDRQQR